MTWDNVDFDKSPAMYDMPVTSAICSPISGSEVKPSETHVEVKGYAWSGQGNRIARVDLTTDQGKTWRVFAEEFLSWNFLFYSKPPLTLGLRRP